MYSYIPETRHKRVNSADVRICTLNFYLALIGYKMYFNIGNFVYIYQCSKYKHSFYVIVSLSFITHLPGYFVRGAVFRDRRKVLPCITYNCE